MNIQYQEYKPSAGLNKYVESYWYVESQGSADKVSKTNYCIPKGTVELIILLKGKHTEKHEEGEWVSLPAELVSGIQTNAVAWRMYGGSAKFGVRLKPETFISLFGTPLAAIHQKHYPLQAIAGDRYDWLAERLRDADDNESRIALVESFLYKKLAVAKSNETLVTDAIRKIWDSEGSLSTMMLSKSVYIGERQLQRLFKTTVGISPKLYSRIVRFRFAYEQANSGKSSAWADVAYSFGYTDQAHFVKEFKSFAGQTPTALFN